MAIFIHKTFFPSSSVDIKNNTMEMSFCHKIQIFQIFLIIDFFDEFLMYCYMMIIQVFESGLKRSNVIRNVGQF